MSNEIDWRNVELSKQYHYEEKFGIEAEVTVIAEIESNENYVGYEIIIDKPIMGCNKGQVFEVGKIMCDKEIKCCYVKDMKFRSIKDVYDYNIDY